jgi:hypothetical protein
MSLLKYRIMGNFQNYYIGKSGSKIQEVVFYQSDLVGNK